MRFKNIIKKATALTLAVATVIGGIATTTITSNAMYENLPNHTEDSSYITGSFAQMADTQAAEVADVFNYKRTITVPADGTIDMYRLYNPNSGEHFYTGSSYEAVELVAQKWRYEGVCWIAPAGSDTPVYRLYNPNSGVHHYTINANERDFCVTNGWNDEGIGWYSAEGEDTEPLYREYNPNNGQHNYTTGWGEHAVLVTRFGWNDENIGWYGLSGSIAKNSETNVTDGSFPLELNTLYFTGRIDDFDHAIYVYFATLDNIATPNSNRFETNMLDGLTYPCFVQQGPMKYKWDSAGIYNGKDIIVQVAMKAH